MLSSSLSGACHLPLGHGHLERSGRSEQKIELDFQIVNQADVERVKHLGGHDVQFDLGEALARTGSFPEPEWQDETGFSVPRRVAFLVDPSFRNELCRSGEVFLLQGC